ncbi:MAG: tetratricopeptide repeat protein [Armatimonadota bacterium]
MLDVRDYWNFGDPVATRAAFEELLPTLTDRAEQLDVHAQIARTYSLPGENQKCLDYLGTYWKEGLELGGRAAASLMIEAGRAYRGLGMIEQARKGFEDVSVNGPEDLRIDALHMLALISEGDQVAFFNQKAITLAKTSKDEWARRWIGSLYNNMGWSCFEAGELDEALEYFESVLLARYEFGQSERVREAQWCIGHTLLAMGRIKDATDIHLEMGGNGETEEDVRRTFSE